MDRKEAIEVIRDYYYPSIGKDLNEALETLIPELKESEDERIRKEMLEYCYKRMNNEFSSITIHQVKRWLAWLEKQGEQNPKSADFIPTDCTSDAKNENRWHKVEDSLPDNAREVLCKDAIGNFFIGRYYNDGDYWEVSMYDEPDKSNKDNPPVIMWANIPSCKQILANSEKTCKVEPKFKVGDIIADIYCTGKVIELTSDSYLLDTGQGIPFSCEHNTHLWTIQDAKVGDVLYSKKGRGVETIDLVSGWKKVDGENSLCSACTYRIEDDEILTGGLGAIWWDGVQDPFYPATKEQRDLLFQKMKEAGYEWNAEKKELRKIEQNPAWSEEDEYVYNEILKRVADKKLYKHDLEYIYNWLKALKERVQPEQDLHPRYIEGKGIYVPIIDVVLNMQDEPKEMTWDEAKDIALSKEQMFVVLYYKDEINALLEKHGGQKLEGWHWTSTQSSGATSAWYVYFFNSGVSLTTRTNGSGVRAFSAYHPES